MLNCTSREAVWYVPLKLCGSEVSFKIDTGADVSVVTSSVWEKLQNKPKLQSSSIKLNCPSGALKCVGKFITVIRKGDSNYRLKIVVVDNENTSCLLSRDVATKMGLIVPVEETLNETLDDIAPNLVGAKYFTTLDAASGFWQIPLHEDSQLLTTFITPFGRYPFRRLPFGINSAPEIFQRKMVELLTGLEGVEVIIDDIYDITDDN